jgi:hypothetical protein
VRLELLGQLAELITMLSAALALTAGLSESVAVTVKSEVPVVVGVPEITPLAELIESPAGRLPLVMLQM